MYELLVRSPLIGRRKQWHVILSTVSLLFGVRVRHHWWLLLRAAATWPKNLFAFVRTYYTIMTIERAKLTVYCLICQSQNFCQTSLTTMKFPPVFDSAVLVFGVRLLVILPGCVWMLLRYRPLFDKSLKLRECRQRLKWQWLKREKTDTNIIALSKVAIQFFYILPDCVLSITNDEFYLEL